MGMAQYLDTIYAHSHSTCKYLPVQKGQPYVTGQFLPLHILLRCTQKYAQLYIE